MNGRKILALVLAVAMIAGTGVTLVGALRSGKNSSYTSFQYSEGLTEDGYFKGVDAVKNVTLPDYKSYTIPKELTVASEEDVLARVAEIKTSFTKEVKDLDEERISANGDKVNVDYVGSVDGVEFVGGNTNGNGSDITIGAGGYLAATEECAGFEEQLIGHKIGETFDITVQFPDGYNASKDADGNEVELANQIAVFKITLNNFYKTEVPEIDDAFIAENLSGFYKNVDDMMAVIEKEVIDDQIKGYVWEQLKNDVVVNTIPKKVQTYHDDAELSSMAGYLSYYGMTVEDYIKAVGYDTVADYLEYADTKGRAEDALLVQAICEKEGIKMSEEDVLKYFETFYGSSDISQFENAYGMSYLKKAFMSEKMLETIIADMTIAD